MFNRRKTLLILFCLLLGGFGFGLYRLMALRFESGDVFPAYSSLRSDPLGSKALYESFGSLPGVIVERNVQKLERLKESPPATLFLLGLSPDDLESSMAKQLEELAQAGHRVVMTMEPVQGEACGCPEKEGEGQGEEEEAPGGDGGENEPVPAEAMGENGEPVVSFSTRWGFRFGYAKLFAGEGRAFPSAILASESHREQLPLQVSQHSELIFAEPDESWTVLYRFAGHPVIMERPMGEGSQVLVSDSYLLSNEAMRYERHPAILSWLAGRNGRLVFDETHLGIRRQQGVMVLVRQYRLTPFLGALLGLALLYLWQRTVPFIPWCTASSSDGLEETSAMDYHAGLVNLLKRNVKEDDLLPVCFNEWLKSMPAAGKLPETARIRREVEVAQALSARERNVLGCYKKIAGILAERKHLWK